MSRRKSREMALQTLFQLDYNTADKSEAIQAVLMENENLSENTRNYTECLVAGTQEKIAEIDAIIMEVSEEWKLDRMAGIDRNIARIAIYEMKYGAEKLSPNVVINEAVELAKIYGTEESSRFVNGILGALVKKSIK